MREFFLTYKEAFNIGLRRHHRQLVNAQQLIDAYNVKIGPNGLEPYTAMTNSFTGLTAVSWPFPIIFNTRQGLMAGDATKLYSISGAFAATTVGVTVTSGSIWHLADFGDYQVWTNGQKVVTRSASTGLYSIETLSYKVNSVCNFRGQLVAGGFDSALNTVAWGDIGDVDLTTMLAPSTLQARKNVAGFMPMPWLGTVYSVKVLGDKVVVYGTAGINALFPVTAPAPTFGLIDVLGVGIAGPGAVGGDDKQHLFVDNKGWLWELGPDLVPRKLGYKEYMSELDPADIMISIDDGERDFYISDGATTYLYNTGLSEVFQHPTSVVYWGGNALFLGNTGSDVTALIVTDNFDCGIRAIKTVTGVEADTSKYSDVTVALDAVYEEGQAWERSTYKQLFKNGTVTPLVGGVMFRLCIKAVSYVDMQLTYANVRYKVNDKRLIRGTYASDVKAAS